MGAVELWRRPQLLAVYLGFISEDRSLKSMREFRGYPMTLLEFSYVPKGICPVKVGHWLVFPVVLAVNEINILGPQSGVEIRNENFIRRTDILNHNQLASITSIGSSNQKFVNLFP